MPGQFQRAEVGFGWIYLDAPSASTCKSPTLPLPDLPPASLASVQKTSIFILHSAVPDDIPPDLASQGRDQSHIRAQVSDHCNLPPRSAQRLEFGSHIAHVGDHNGRPPAPVFLAIAQTGEQQHPLENIGRSNPTDQRHQQDRRTMFTPPQTQGVFSCSQQTSGSGQL
jgi:hypothetical protein